MGLFQLRGFPRQTPPPDGPHCGSRHPTQAGTSRRLLGLDAKQVADGSPQATVTGVASRPEAGGPWGPGDVVWEGGLGASTPSCQPALWPPHPPPALDPHFPHPLSKRAEPDNGQRAPEGSAPTFCDSEPERSGDLPETYRLRGPREGPGPPRDL